MNHRHPPFPAAPQPSGHQHVPQRDNPLRRPSDRLRMWVDVLLLAVLALGSVTAGLAAGSAGYDAQTARVQQQAEWRQTTARVTTAPEGAPGLGPDAASQQARIRWTDDRGENRTAIVPVPDGATRGEEIRIWIDRSGAVTSRPDSPASPVLDGWAAGLMAAGAVITVTLTARIGARRLFDRHHDRCWEEEWATVEPQWAGRQTE